MSQQQLLQRITRDPKVMVGKPVIRGTQLTLEYVLNRLGHGSTVGETLDEYTDLTREDIRACLLFASQSLSDTAFMPLKAEPTSMRFLVDERTGGVVAGCATVRTKSSPSSRKVAECRTTIFSKKRIPRIGSWSVTTWILVSNNKDFGERVYREKRPHRGVVFLRLQDERATARDRCN